MSPPSAPPSPRPRRAGRAGGFTLVVLALLLVLPVCALRQLATWVDWRILAGAPAALSLFAYLAYRSDKHRAEAGQWRIPEATLHAVELVGGWPGAFLAQRMFRHKTSKISYQVVFWIIVALHEFIALDSLSGWRAVNAVLHFIRTQTT